MCIRDRNDAERGIADAAQKADKDEEGTRKREIRMISTKSEEEEEADTKKRGIVVGAHQTNNNNNNNNKANNDKGGSAGVFFGLSEFDEMEFNNGLAKKAAAVQPKGVDFNAVGDDGTLRREIRTNSARPEEVQVDVVAERDDTVKGKPQTSLAKTETQKNASVVGGRTHNSTIHEEEEPAASRATTEKVIEHYWDPLPEDGGAKKRYFPRIVRKTDAVPVENEEKKPSPPDPAPTVTDAVPEENEEKKPSPPDPAPTVTVAAAGTAGVEENEGEARKNGGVFPVRPNAYSESIRNSEIERIEQKATDQSKQKDNSNTLTITQTSAVSKDDIKPNDREKKMKSSGCCVIM
eukprot:TRINITY_DN1683_c0_g2_i2.p1 TRINITY_DN1683_c0_g2~~TRINITY_DN1683_c0_g2_i2.p1  ORF type:complete len:370 (-),score=110.93 TRINITY_DN1683_c0_g2_i2:194-1243(-)